MSANVLAMPAQYDESAASPPREAGDLSTIKVLLPYLALHAVLGPILRASPAAATIHASIALAVGIWAALRWDSLAILCCAAYIVGGETLWRMSGARVPYEFGKYAVSLIFLVALARRSRSHRAAWRVLPLLYFGLLLPSALLVFADYAVRDRSVVMRLSFNLSGPLCLCVSVWFLSQLKLRAKDIPRLCLAVVGPIVGIAMVTIIATRTAENLVFTDESNTITSGGFGPNQISAILGLGALMALLFTLNRDIKIAGKVIGTGLVLLFVTQSAMTFSRGGLYAAVAAGAAGIPFMMADRRVRRVVFPLIAAIMVIGIGVILPRLDEFTGGKLTQRFEQVQSTNRLGLMLDDLQIWSEHPALGVGPGMVKKFRGDLAGSGHTEFTRLLAEHGTLGLCSLVILTLMTFQAFLRRGSRFDRGHRFAFLVWALLSMLHAAMRIAAFGFFFGLAHVTFLSIQQRSPAFDRALNRRH